MEIRVVVALLDSNGTVVYDAVCLDQVDIEFDAEDGSFYAATVSPGFPGDVDAAIDEALSECEDLFPYDTKGEVR
jgi:hypothetical protein